MAQHLINTIDQSHVVALVRQMPRKLFEEDASSHFRQISEVTHGGVTRQGEAEVERNRTVEKGFGELLLFGRGVITGVGQPFNKTLLRV